MSKTENAENTTRQRTKEELKREKLLNRSLTMLPKTTQIALGIMAIQKDDGVFFLGNNRYQKIYSIKNSVLGQKKGQFVELLLENTMNRVRISSFSKIKNQKLAAYTFLSIYFECTNYAAAHDEIGKFDAMLQNVICKELSISISGCSIDTALMFMHMNSAGKMKQVEYNSMLSKKQNLKNELFTELKEIQGGMFTCNDKYGICFIGEYFGENAVEINNLISGIEGNVQFAVDMQRLSDEDWKIYNYQLSDKYNHVVEEEQRDIINLTYLLAVLADSEDEIIKLKSQLVIKFEENGILLVPCSGREKQIFNSICSIGAIDFHSMRNASVDLASSLIL